jgi:Xaa-Pro dipeptidase
MSQTVTTAPMEQELLDATAANSEIKLAELKEKRQRLAEFLKKNHLSCILLSRHENIAWITGGQVEARVAYGSETAVTSLLFTGAGLSYYLAPNNEGPRLAAEEFAGLGYEPALYPWHQGRGELVTQLATSGKIASDTSLPGTTLVSLGSLRAPLLPAEMIRLRALGRATAEATTEVLQSLEPGVTEYEMAARTSSALLSRGITPTVILMGTDERIFKYRHAVPRAGRLEKYGMVNLCARKWGLIVSMTRFVHFGAMPQTLSDSFVAAARINSELLHATHAGTTASELFAAAQKAYVSVGAAEELELHHQGGPCGYVEREWLILPGSTQTVAPPQAFAYNPSLRGAKTEDTVIVGNGPAEAVTATPDLPAIETVIDGTRYVSAGALQK